MSTVAHILERGNYRTATDLGAIAAALAEPETVLWIDTDERSPELEKFFQDCLGIHPLVIEDIFSERQTPKVEDHASHLYIVMHGVHKNGDRHGMPTTIELDVLISSRWLLTHHSAPSSSIDAVVEGLRRNPRLLSRGPAFVAHAIIDHLTDQYLPLVDQYQEEIDEIERSVIERPQPEQLGQMFALKRSLQRLRRISAYQRDLLLRLSRQEFELIPVAAVPFYRDVYDHFVRIADLADSYRELVTAALEIYMSVVANRTNDIMKVLALISTIMLPLTFIAGVYGMNFHHMPELDWLYGYPMALLFMAMIALGMVLFFRRRSWL
jgi:magnesium transporter